MPAPAIAQSAAPAALLPPVGPSQESVRRRQQLADAMMEQATKPAPVYSVWEGLAKMASAGLAGWQQYGASRDADKAQAAAMNQLLGNPLIEELINAHAGVSPSSAAGGAPDVGGTMAMDLGAAAGSYSGDDLPDWQRALMLRESSGRPGIVNDDGYSGLYQFGEAAAHDAGFYSGDDNLKDNQWGGTFTAGPDGQQVSYDEWLHSPQAQNYGFGVYDQRLEREIARLGLDRYIGQTVRGVPITMAGLKMGAHLGGLGGVQGFLSGSGNASDSNGTSVGSYIAMGSKFPDAVAGMLQDGPLQGEPIGSSGDLVAAAGGGKGGRPKGPQYRQDIGKPDLTTMLGTDPLQLSPPYGQAPGSDLNPIPSTPSGGAPIAAQPVPMAGTLQSQLGATEVPPAPPATARELNANNTFAFQRDPRLEITGDVAPIRPQGVPTLPIMASAGSVARQDVPTVPTSSSPAPYGQGIGVGAAAQSIPPEVLAALQPGAAGTVAPAVTSAVPPSVATALPPPAAAQDIGPGAPIKATAPAPDIPDTFAMLEQQGVGQPQPVGRNQVETPPAAPAAPAESISPRSATAAAPAAGGDREANLRALIAAMSNPWLSDTGRQIGGILLGRALGADPSEAPEMRDRIDGGDQVVEQWDPQRGWVEVSRGPRWDPNGLADAGMTDKLRNLEAAGIDPKSPQGQAYLLNPGGTTVTLNTGDNANAGDKEFYGALGKQDAERFGAISAAGAAARGTLGNLNALEAYLQNTPQGALQPFVNELAGLAQGLGIDVDSTDLASAQAVEAIVARIAPALRVPGSGTTSDRDLSLFLQSLPGIAKLPDANRIIISTLRAFADRAIQEAGIVNQVRSGQITRSGADKMLAALGAIVTPEMAQGWQRSAAAVPTTGLAAGTPAFGGAQPAAGGYDPLSSTQPGPVRVQTEAEFLALPPGTEAQFPDGKTGTRP